MRKNRVVKTNYVDTRKFSYRFGLDFRMVSVSPEKKTAHSFTLCEQFLYNKGFQLAQACLFPDHQFKMEQFTMIDK